MSGKNHSIVVVSSKRGRLPDAEGKDITTTAAKGLGDTIASMTKAVGIKPCGGCKKRRKWLNEKFPYKQKSEQL